MAHVTSKFMTFPTLSLADEDSDDWSSEPEDVEIDGPPLPGGGSGGAPYTNEAQPLLLGSKGEKYAFQFWDATQSGSALRGFPSTSTSLAVPQTEDGSEILAIAWYEPVSDGRVLPGGVPGYRARTFDADLNKFRRETPVAATNPESNRVWAGANHHGVVTAESDVHVRAKERLIHTEGPLFNRWIMPKGSSGDEILLRQNDSGTAVAVYKVPEPRFPGHPDQIPYWLWLLLHGIITKEALDHLRPHPRPNEATIASLGAMARLVPGFPTKGGAPLPLAEALTPHLGRLQDLHTVLGELLSATRKR